MKPFRTYMLFGCLFAGIAGCNAKLNYPIGQQNTPAGTNDPDAVRNQISTIAGVFWPFTGSGKAATTAQLDFPTSTAFDSNGNYYIVDRNNSVVRKVTPGGIITTVVGDGAIGYSGDGGPAAFAQLNGPIGIAIAANGDWIITDSLNSAIRRVSATTSVITTIAGTGTSGYSGDGGPATAALLGQPTGVALDPGGNIYFADTCEVRKISSGVITTIAGTGTCGYSGDGGPAAAAQVNVPYSIALDTSNNIYLADQYNFVVRKIAAVGGAITTVAGTPQTFGYSGDGGQATSATLGAITGVTVDAAGNIFIVDGPLVRKVTGATGIISTIAGTPATNGYTGDGGAATAATFSNAMFGITVRPNGDLLVSDCNNDAIRLVSGGNISTIAGNHTTGFVGDSAPAISAELNSPWGVATDAKGNIFISDTSNHRVRKVTAATGIISTYVGNGSVGFAGDGGLATAASLTNPAGLTIDASGNLYIADLRAYVVRKVDPVSGIISRVAGTGGAGSSGDNGAATAAKLNHPSAVAVDSVGNVFICDNVNLKIRRVDAVTGIITTFAGTGAFGYSGDNGPATAAQLEDPYGVAVDLSGNVYIADGSYVIRKVDRSGIITTVAGNGTIGYSGDGDLATRAELGLLDSVTTDLSGNLYFTSSSPSVLRKVTVATGIITTLAGQANNGYSGDGAAPANATLNGPTGLTVDASGVIYFADGTNNVVRKIIP